MREYLFRGKMESGEWVYGDLLHDEGKCYIVERDSYSAFFPKGGYAEVYICEVDPDTVGQFIGLEDMNGKKIFEGDIVEWVLSDGECYLYEIGFYEGSFAYRDLNYTGYDRRWYSVFDFENRLLNDEVRVITNLFDLFDSSRWARTNPIPQEELKKALNNCIKEKED